LFQKCDLVNRFVRICGEKMTLVLEVKKQNIKASHLIVATNILLIWNRIW
jgi:hypothetical protein